MGQWREVMGAFLDGSSMDYLCFFHPELPTAVFIL